MSNKNLDILSVENLCMSFPPRKGGTPSDILDNLSFRIREGEILGLIGNSGCGKSMTALALSGLLPEDATITSGNITFDGKSLLDMNKAERRKLLGNEIGLIFQEPMTALNPLMQIGNSLDEILTTHGIKSKEERRAKIVEMLSVVGFSSPEDIYSRYPHQLSGGQRQRVLIAGAALLRPRLLIADEPTSSLDTITAVSILELLKSLCVKLHMTILFISHDLSIVNNFCDRVMVMKNGSIIESDNAYDIIHNPKNAFTAELLTKAALDPRMLHLEFAKTDYEKEPVFTCKNIFAGYRDSLFSRKSNTSNVNILNDISFDVFPGEIIGLIGGSGCGKTTLAKVMTELLPKESGEINNYGQNLGIVFQDPGTCLNPSHTIYWHLNEPLIARKIRLGKAERLSRILQALNDVGLEEKHLYRYPRQLSGGQRQRVAIAMCLIVNPSMIIADEPLSSLDASSSAQILKLLSDINREHNTAIFLISHNLRVIRAAASRVLVIDKGMIVENGQTSNVLSNPNSDMMRLLLSCEKTLHSDDLNRGLSPD